MYTIVVYITVSVWHMLVIVFTSSYCSNGGAPGRFFLGSLTHIVSYIVCIIVTTFFRHSINTSHTHIRLIHVYIYMKVYIYIYQFSLCGRFVSINTITNCLVVCFSGGKVKNVVYKLLCDNWDKGNKDSWWEMNVAHSISHAHIKKKSYSFLFNV